jgi:hypothetical protein
MRERPGDWWPLWVVAVLVAAVGWLLYAVLRSPHRSDLAIYGAFAVPVIMVAAGWVTWTASSATVRPSAAHWSYEALSKARASRMAIRSGSSSGASMRAQLVRGRSSHVCLSCA